MARLRSRERFIPGGFRFHQPETGWRSPDFASFDTVCQLLQRHRMANPALVAQYQWNMDIDSIEAEVDAYCAAICYALGWTDYIQSDGGAPQPAVPFFPVQSARRAVVGANTIAEMFGPDGPVEKPVAIARAEICAKCTMNDKGDWTRIFTIPASNAIRSMLGVFKGLKLETPQDSELNVCTACYCPIKLKVWARLPHILKHMPADDYAALDAGCWVRSENKPPAADVGLANRPAQAAAPMLSPGGL